MHTPGQDWLVLKKFLEEENSARKYSYIVAVAAAAAAISEL